MAGKKATAIIFAVMVIALLAGAAYLTRHRWAHYLSSAKAEKSDAGAFNIVEKAGEKFKECYVCPMHTQVVRPAPGDCPICGMTLMKKTEPFGAEKKPSGMAEMSGMAGAPGKPAETVVEGRISLDPRQRMLANVATSMVMYEDLSQDVSAVGKVAFDEKTVRKVSAWFPGRVERLYVNFTGQRVKKGEPIMEIYSPELVATEREYLLAKETGERLRSSGFSEISESSMDVTDAARNKMKLWGITDGQLEELDRTGKTKTRAEVYAPISGTVVEMMAREGDYLLEGSVMYKVADLSRVWVFAEVYEYELSQVGVGSTVEVTTEAYPGKTFHGKVSFVDPTVNPDSRTVRLRAEFPNPGGLLKPEMFVNARVSSRSRRALTVPASAILYTGKRNVAWVEAEPGEFGPRDVKLGVRSGDSFEVLDGLKEHDMVVTQGGFLLDSEAQLRESAGGSMPGMEMGGAKKKEEKSGGMPDMPGM